MWQKGEGPDTDATSGNERWYLKMWAVTDKAKSPIWQKKTNTWSRQGQIIGTKEV